MTYQPERQKELTETAVYQQQELNQFVPAPLKVLPVHPMKRSKYDFEDRRLPDKFVQKFTLNHDHPPISRDPFFERLKAAFGKNAFTVKNAIDILATDVKFEAVNPEEIEQRIFGLIRFGHILEV
jgi:hypothetical protein